ncbi:MAG: PKD domain-containing protein [Flavobacteriaceae bacterium]|nr:PKD domain-containing protein [Flavobacteriaceae bacterium]
MRKKEIYRVFIILVASLFWACYQETLVPVEVDFSTSFTAEDRSVPVRIQLENRTQGADTYSWTFEGGTPSSSNEKSPSEISYKSPGTYTITLKASNRDDSVDSLSKSIRVYDKILIDYDITVLKNNYPPVTIAIENRTKGKGLYYNWTFDGGIPNTFKGQHPPQIQYNSPGNHAVTLEVGSDFESFAVEKMVTVAPEMKVNFDWKVDFFDDDYQAPVHLQLQNHTENAIAYQWTMPGATTLNSSEKEPRLLFENPGVYRIRLLASNGKVTSEIEKQLVVKENTNLRSFTDLEFGINTAHHANEKGAFFSGSLRKILNLEDLNVENQAKVDLAFFGLNADFTFNKFVSPDAVQNNGFASLSGAKKTKIINRLDQCDCGISFSTQQFDAMQNDSPLRAINIQETAAGSLSFDDSVLPRLVLFQTEDGRKGVLKIKAFEKQGNASFIRCDLKIQKLAVN